MKVLIVNTSDIEGGAARAAYRLHKSLLNKNIDSKMLVQRKQSDDQKVIGPKTAIEKLSSAVRPRLDNFPYSVFRGNSATQFSCAWVPSGKLVKKINLMNADIVHLHWINGGMLRIEDIAKIKSSVVWSLHDMWPFSGGWHYNESNPSPIQKRFDSWMYRRKKKALKKVKNLSIVGLSNWIKSQATYSGMFENRYIVNLPNPIDTEVFRPLDKAFTRQLWGLPPEKKLILFGAVGATTDLRKGFKELMACLPKISSENIELVVFGASHNNDYDTEWRGKIHFVGHIHDDQSLTALYSAVDAVLVPSLQENLSNAVMESLACGTPVIAFDVGGNSDMITHKTNGYLAKLGNIGDLANGISWVVYNDDYKTLCDNAREKVCASFDSKHVGKLYEDFYNELINNFNE